MPSEDPTVTPMGYPRHWLLAFGGHQGHIEEEWACGIRLMIQGVQDAPVDEEQYLTNTAVPALTSWFSNPQAKIYQGARIVWVKFNEIDSAGHYADTSATHERQGLAIAANGGSAPLHPLQCAYCLTWTTSAATRGPASMGRIFSPRPVLTVDINGDVASAERLAVAGAAKGLLEALDVSVGVPPGAVLRPAIVSPVGTGQANQIDFVGCDSRLDIQRRRAASQSRENSQVAVVY